ncbi:MAG: hypothetical protein ABL867_07330 [Rickettsiales bacterium]
MLFINKVRSISNKKAIGYSAPFTSVQDGVKDYVQNYLLKEDPCHTDEDRYPCQAIGGAF